MSLGRPIAAKRITAEGARPKTIFGVAIADRGRDEAIRLVLDALRRHRPLKLAFCNAHTANLAWGDEAFRRALAGFTVLPDGIGVDIAARALHGAPFAANLNGTDFMPALLTAETRPLRLALYGGRPGVAERAAEALVRLAPQHRTIVSADGFGGPEAEAAFLDTLRAAPADVLLVALGNPRQELWIARNVGGDHATLAVGVGALFDFLAGDVRRAPAAVRHLRLEWAWRLAQEPRRLAGRYLAGNPLFLARVAAVKLGLRRFP